MADRGGSRRKASQCLGFGCLCRAECEPSPARPPRLTPLQGNPRIIWSDSKKIIVQDHGYEVTEYGPSRTTQNIFPPETIWFAYKEGAAWALGPRGLKTSNKETFTGALLKSVRYQQIWRRVDGENWEKFGELNDELANASAILPLGGNDFVIFPSLIGFKVEKQYSPMVVVRKGNSNELHFQRRISLDFGDPMIPLKSQKIVPGCLVRNPKFLIFMNLMTEPSLALFQAEKGFYLGSMHMGIFWYFDEKAQLKMRYQLYAEMNDDDFSDIWKFERAVLGCQVNSDGSLVVAFRKKEAAFFAQQFYPSVLDEFKNSVEPGLAKMNRERANSLFPEVTWWVLDPNVPKPTSLFAPPGLPTTMNEIQGRDLNFAIRWDGVIPKDPA